jgi:hypothetical protein
VTTINMSRANLSIPLTIMHILANHHPPPTPSIPADLPMGSRSKTNHELNRNKKRKRKIEHKLVHFKILWTQKFNISWARNWYYVSVSGPRNWLARETISYFRLYWVFLCLPLSELPYYSSVTSNSSWGWSLVEAKADQ